MARVTVEDCLDKVHNRFALVVLVAKRAKQILKGSDLTVAARGNKYIVSSLREVAAGNVRFDTPSFQEAEDQIESDLNR
ncbi:MAG: DNA-directed RNA polymerase subunit omega [Pseudobdellovibrionaceae bacterium]